jgi:hypothetical protein
MDRGVKMAESIKKLDQSLRIRQTVESAPSVYANNAEVSITTWDFRLKFGEIEKITESEISVAERVRIAMSPQHAKAFSKVLAEHVTKYEEAFGEIQVEPSQKTTK